jgi:hypothetical protein
LQIAGHSILSAILWNCARSVDLTSKAAITSFYMFIWKVTPAHPAPPMSYTYFIISVTTLGAADCTALFNHITFCTPLILDGATSRVDELLTLTPHVAPQLFYAEYLLIPLVR